MVSQIDMDMWDCVCICARLFESDNDLFQICNFIRGLDASFT